MMALGAFAVGFLAVAALAARSALDGRDVAVSSLLFAGFVVGALALAEIIAEKRRSTR